MNAARDEGGRGLAVVVMGDHDGVVLMVVMA